MKMTLTSPESRWATYLKSAALALPPLAVWMFMCVMVVPKLKEICFNSGTAFPAPLIAALTISDFVKNNLLLGLAVIMPAIFLLEWRSTRWNRYRNVIFGATAYLLNLAILAILAVLCVLAVVAAIPAPGK